MVPPKALKRHGVPWNPRGLTDPPGRIRKRYIARSLVQGLGATDGCAPCQGDSQVHVPRCRKRFDDIFDGEKESGQPLALVRQEELGRVAEGAMPVAQLAQVVQEPKQQRAIIPEPIAIPPQPFSSSHEDPRRARIPEDEDDAKTVRPRWDMSALIRELCERDVPGIDWAKVGENNSSVFDIYWMKPK